MELQLELPIKLSVEATSVLFALIIFLFGLQKWIININNTKGKLPPIPSNSWPIIGHLHCIKGLPHIALGKLAITYGPIFMIKLGFRRALVVSTVEMAKECFSGMNENVFLNRPQTAFVNHMGYNTAMLIFSPHGPYWRDIRKIITAELLSNQRIEMFKDVRRSEVRSAIKRVSNIGLESVDMKQWFSDINLNILARLISSKPLKEYFPGEEYNLCKRAFTDFFELQGASVPGDALPFIRFLDIGGYEKRMKKTSKVIDRVAQRWLDEHKQRRLSREAQENQDFMDVMLNMFETGDAKTSKFNADTIIKATCLLLILGGTDTSDATLVWTLSLLLHNTDILNKIQAELDTVVGMARKVEEADLKNLVYLQASLKESMRSYPASPLSVPRESIIDCTVGGYHIPASTQLIFNVYKLHRDPRVWKDPLVFNPERFLTTHKDYDVRGQSYEIMPFGSGKRVCPGASFALHNVSFVLVNLLHGFEISLPSYDQTVNMTSSFGISNLKAMPLEVTLKRRLPRNLYD